MTRPSFLCFKREGTQTTDVMMTPSLRPASAPLPPYHP